MRKNRRKLLSLLLALALGFVLLLTVAPFLWALSTSFKPDSDIHRWPPQWIPSPPILEHYAELFTSMNFLRIFFNSVVISLAVTVVSLFCNSLAGFVFAKHPFPLREKVFGLLLLTMMVPGQVTLIPIFLLLKKIGLLNSYLSLILPGAVSVFGIFLMRQFIRNIPDTYLEAARIDGCGEFQIFWRIVMPLCKPALAALAIFTFTGVWSDFMLPLILLHDESMYTLPVALANLNGQHIARWGLLMAGAVVTILPIAILFLILQRKFIEGLTLPGMKG